MADKARAKVPERVVAGETFAVKVLLRHRMETGNRTDENGEIVPRDIAHRFEALFEDGRGEAVELFAVDLGPGVAANPYFEFDVRLARSGTLRLRWTEDGGEVVELVHDVTVRA